MHNDTCISVLDGLYMYIYILLTLESVSSSQLNLILWLKSIPVFMSVFYHLDEPLLDYALPFQSQVPPDPTLEDMRELVVEKQAIPEIPEVWSNNEVIHRLMQF